MSWQDRAYNKEEAGFGGYDGGRSGMRFGGGMGGYSMVMWLLIINCVVFLWDMIFGGSLRGSALAIGPYGYFSVEKAIFGGQVWRFFTYQFLHAGFFHIFFNMLILYIFGPRIEQWWGSKRFLAFYLFCGVSGALVASVLGAIPGMHIFPTQARLVGASGSIFGLLIASAMLFPNMRVMLMIPPIPMTMRTMALVFLGIAVLSVLAGSGNAGGEAAHLGGALLGFVLVKLPRTLDWADRMSPSAIQNGINNGRYERKRKQELANRAEVDRILDKVREKGLASLTRKEKKILSEETERQKRAG